MNVEVSKLYEIFYFIFLPVKSVLIYSMYCIYSICVTHIAVDLLAQN